MPRLIDADELSKLVGEPIEVFLRRLDLKLPPIVDAVEVVRCKDCKHCAVDREADGNVPVYVCIEMYCGVEADGFCAWGERREDETD